MEPTDSKGGDTAAAGKAADDKKGPAAAPPAAPPAAKVKHVAEANGRTDDRAVGLLLDACEVFGVDPDMRKRPAELAAWHFYEGDELENRPDAVVFVTHGGLKVKHWDDDDTPMDPDTEERLRNTFRAWGIDAATKERVALPLPADLTLPRFAVTGQTGKTDHVYQAGYLKEGGAGESAKRETKRQQRAGKK